MVTAFQTNAFQRNAFQILPPFPIPPAPSTRFGMQIANAKQSGLITPGHLAAWVTDNVLADAGVQFNNTYGKFVATLQGVNFNATNFDNPININLPLGYTRYRIEQIIISGASATLTTATCGVFTLPGATGTAVVTSGTGVTVSSGLNDTVNNMQLLTVNNQTTMSLSDVIIYFRTQTPQGVIATGNVSVFYQPLP